MVLEWRKREHEDMDVREDMVREVREVTNLHSTSPK